MDMNVDIAIGVNIDTGSHRDRDRDRDNYGDKGINKDTHRRRHSSGTDIGKWTSVFMGTCI